MKNILAGLSLFLAIILALIPYSFNPRLLVRGDLPFEKQEVIAADSVIFLTGTASTTWVVPSDWNSSSNTIEVIGGGGGGANGVAVSGNSPGVRGGAGGGGGGYSKVANTTLTAGGTVGIQVGAGGAVGAAGTDTYLCNSTANCASISGTAVQAGAKGGGGAVNQTIGSGGAAASGVGTTKFSGGNGGTSGTTGNKGGTGGGGGGGSAGKNGNGNVGATSADVTGDAGTNGGAGGSGDAGSGGAGGTGGTGGNPGAGGTGNNGGNGTEYDATHGSGGGGGGGGGGGRDNSGGAAAVNSGLYGAGGAGGGGAGEKGASSGVGRAGRQGLIIITYTPAASAPLISSAVNQTFTVADGATVISTISVTSTAASQLTAANDIRIKINTSTTNFRWDTSDTLATISGTGASKASTTVSYADASGTLIINVTTDFAANDNIQISGLSYVNFNAVNAATTTLRLFKDGASDAVSDASDDKTVVIKGRFELAAHSTGQETNKFGGGGTVSNAELFDFQLLPNDESASTTLTVNLFSITGIVTGDITSPQIFVDTNTNGNIDVGETTTAFGAGTVSISGGTGTISFTATTSTVASATSTRYILKATSTNLLAGDTITFSLATSSINADGQTSKVRLTPTAPSPPANAVHSAANPQISSAANQTFTVNDAATAVSIISVSSTDVGQITAANDIRISISTSTTNFRWDNSDTAAVISGGASAKVSTTVSYEGVTAAGADTLVVNVTTDFAANDNIQISGLSYKSFNTVNAAITTLDLKWQGAGQAPPFIRDAKTVVIRGQFELQAHSAGQEADKFTEAATVSNAELFSFQLNPADEPASTTLTVQLSSITGIVTGDITSPQIFVDSNANGNIDAGETTTAFGAGTVSIGGGTGTISFTATTSTVVSATSTRYILKATTTNLIAGDTITFGLGASNVTADGQTSKVRLSPVAPTPPANAVHSAKAALTLTQRDFRWYNNADSVQPSSTAIAAENATGTISSTSSPVRLRMNITAGNQNLATSTKRFNLQWSTSTGGGWVSIGKGGDYDNGFGSGGAVTSTAASQIAQSIAIDSNYMYVAGYDNTSIWLIEKRLLSDGSLVSGFGSGGVVTGTSTSTQAFGIAIDSTNMYVVGYGGIGNDWYIEKRLLSDGSLVSGFGNNGLVIGGSTSTQAKAIKIDSTYMYIVGYGDSGFRIEKRLLSDGSLVSGFGTGGVATSSGTVANAIAIDSTNMYVAGYAGAGVDWRIEKRLLSDGSLVSGFGSGGIVTGDASTDQSNAIAIDSIYMYVGGSNATSDWRIEKRLLSDGSLVSGFGSGGVVTGDTSTVSIFSIDIDPNFIYLVGDTTISSNAWRIEKRLLSDGSLVSGFGSGGAVTFDTAGPDLLRASVIDSSYIYAVGSYETGIDWRIEKRYLGNDWKFFNNSSVSTSSNITSVLLSASESKETYEEQNPSGVNPIAITAGQEGEWDFSLDPANATSTTYYFRMINSGGAALDSYTRYPAITISVTPPLPGQPGTPTYTNISTSTLTVNWTAATGADYYKIERDTDGNAPMPQITTTTALNYNDSGLATSTTYFYRVRGTNAQGDGSYSASSSVTTSGGGFSPSGSLVSLIIDTAITAGVAPNSLFWQGSQPANTTVKFQFSASNATSGPWTYSAWNSSANSCDSSSFYSVGPATPIEIKASCHQNKRYIRYKVFLETTDSAATPRVDRIILNYAQ